MCSAHQRQLKLLFSIIQEQIPTQLTERKTHLLHLRNKIKLFNTVTHKRNCLISPQGEKKLQFPKKGKNYNSASLYYLVILKSLPVYSIYIHSPLPFPSPLKGGHKKITCKIASEKCPAHRQAKARPALTFICSDG